MIPNARIPVLKFRLTGLCFAIILNGLLACPRIHGAAAAASEALPQLHRLTIKSLNGMPAPSREEDFNEFRKLLLNLGATSPDMRGASAEESTLLRVARGLAADPARLDELLAVYGAPPKETSQNRVLLPVALKSAHVNETYRAAWEALVLAPQSDEVLFMQSRFVITDAIARIGNPESVSVLELAFVMTSQDGIEIVQGSAALRKQFRIMESLNRFASKESLDAILRCLSRAETARPGQEPRFSGQSLREWVSRFLKDEDHYNTKEQWRKILVTYPKENLPANQRELLEQVLKQP